jgi:heat shock protein HslJ
MKQVFLILLAIGLVTTSCNSAKETMQPETPMYDTKWSLKKIYDSGSEEAVSTKAFIRFDKEKNSAGGNGSCNSFGSTATVNGNDVNFKNIFSTKMYCEQVQKTEDKYFKQLAEVNRFEIKSNSLILYKDKEKLLEFIAEQENKSTE